MPIIVPSLKIESICAKNHELSLRYTSLKKIGHGVHGMVFKAHDEQTKEDVAIKIISTKNDFDITLASNEIQLMKILQHENVVKFRTSFQDETTTWIVMDYYENGSVGTQLDHMKKGLPESYIIYIAQEVLKGLIYLHQNKIVHYDLKCGNLLVDKDGHIILADFGTAYHEAIDDSIRNMQRGSLPWMSPEVLHECKQNEKIDIWSLGIICIEMAELNSPFFNCNEHELKEKLASDYLCDFIAKKSWSIQFRNFISKCLSSDPIKRPSAKELLSDPLFSTLPSDMNMRFVNLIHQPHVSFIPSSSVGQERSSQSPNSVLFSQNHSSQQNDQKVAKNSVRGLSNNSFFPRIWCMDKEQISRANFRTHLILTNSFKQKIKSKNDHDKETLLSNGTPWR